MRKPLPLTASTLCLMLLATPGQAGWTDLLDRFTGAEESSQAAAELLPASLTQEEMVGGLKEALDKGIRFAVDELGRTDGFLGNPQVRIPLPDSLSWAEQSLRTVGQEQLADDFVLTMNRAAEQAVPEVLDIFQQTLQNMTLEDAQAILQGPDDAATQYFRTHSSRSLGERIRPIVAGATSEAGVTSAYKSMVDKAGFMGQFLSKDALDIDQYVTDKALNGLFLMIAEEERQIRENPVERTSELLKKVFDASVR